MSEEAQIAASLPSAARTLPRRQPPPARLAFLTALATGAVITAVLCLPDQPLQAAVNGAPLPLVLEPVILAVPLLLVLGASAWDWSRGHRRAPIVLRTVLALALVLQSLPLFTSWIQSSDVPAKTTGILGPAFIIGLVAAYTWPTPPATSRPFDAYNSAFTGVIGYLGACLPLALFFVGASIVAIAQPPATTTSASGGATLLLGLFCGLTVGLFVLGLFLAAPLGGLIGGWLRHAGGS